MYWPTDGKATSLTRGKTLRLRYRVVVFAGTPESADLTGRHADFSGKGGK